MNTWPQLASEWGLSVVVNVAPPRNRTKLEGVVTQSTFQSKSLVPLCLELFKRGLAKRPNNVEIHSADDRLKRIEGKIRGFSAMARRGASTLPAGGCHLFKRFAHSAEAV